MKCQDNSDPSSPVRWGISTKSCVTAQSIREVGLVWCTWQRTVCVCWSQCCISSEDFIHSTAHFKKVVNFKDKNPQIDLQGKLKREQNSAQTVTLQMKRCHLLISRLTSIQLNAATQHVHSPMEFHRFIEEGDGEMFKDSTYLFLRIDGNIHVEAKKHEMGSSLRQLQRSNARALLIPTETMACL